MALSRKDYILIAKTLAATLADFDFQKQEDVATLIDLFAIHLQKRVPHTFDAYKFIEYVRVEWATISAASA